MPLAEQQQSQSSALGNFIDQLRLMRVLQSTYINTLPPSLQSEEYAYTLIDPPAKTPGNVMDTSFTELIAKPSIDVADNAPVNRTDNCLLSDCSILPDSSVFDPYHHPVTSLPSQTIYLNNFPEIDILLNILSNLLPQLLYISQHLNHKVKSSMPGQLISFTVVTQPRVLMNLKNCQSSSKIKNLLNLATNRRKKKSPNLTCMVLLSLFLDTAQSLKNMSQCLQKLLRSTKLLVNNCHFKRHVCIQMTLVP